MPGSDDNTSDAAPDDDIWQIMTTEAEVLEVDLAITITNGREIYEPQGTSTYTVIVTNDGPDTATGARVAVTLPQGLHQATWSAIYSPATSSSPAASGPANGVGSGTAGIDALVTLPAGRSAIFTLTGSVNEQAAGQLRVAAAVTAPGDAIDTNTGDNTAVDVDRRPLMVVGAEAARVHVGQTLPPQVQVVDATTGEVRTGFEAFGAVGLPQDRSLRPGVRTCFGDVDQDGIDEILATPTSGHVGELRVFRLQNDGSYVEDPAWRSTPFGDGYLGGLRLASGDFDGDGDDDVAVSRDRGIGEVRILRSSGDSATGFQSNATFTPFSTGNRGGISLTSADLTGDRIAEVIVATGARVTPVVKVFSPTGTSPTEIDSISPSTVIKGDLSVSVGRFNADATPDIFVAGGRGSDGRIEIFDGTVNATAANTKLSGTEAFTTPFANAPSRNAAVFASGVDIDGDGRIDRIIASQGRGGASGAARVFARTGSLISSVSPSFGSEAMLSAVPADARIVQTASGLQYRDLVVGTGAMPTNGQRVSVHYVGSLLNGAVFDNSRTRLDPVTQTIRPFEFSLGARQVIAGWDEGLATMRVGGRRTLIIPANLGYGSNGSGSIPPNSTLVFDVELLAVT